jgi:hypothetical protein
MRSEALQEYCLGSLIIHKAKDESQVVCNGTGPPSFKIAPQLVSIAIGVVGVFGELPEGKFQSSRISGYYFKRHRVARMKVND